MNSFAFTKSIALFAALSSFANAGASGTGATTRYWDCCKPSCAWSGKASVTAPVGTCSINDTPLTDPNAASGCNGGTAYMCSSQEPWAINSTLAYGFAAVNIAGGSESSWCCACYALTFTSGAAAGKTLVVQATNTGGDLGSNQFDLAIPGGGVGIFNGCTQEWGAPANGWGAQYGGISTRSDCATFPTALQAGCYWRFDWFGGSDNPGVTFEQVQCPAEITAKTGCTRSDDSSQPKLNVGAVAASSAAPVAATSKASSSSTTKVVASSLSTVVKPVAASTSTAPQTGVATKWGQCGGKGYTGPTTCIAGSTCQYQNDWYSQCL